MQGVFQCLRDFRLLNYFFTIFLKNNIKKYKYENIVCLYFFVPFLSFFLYLCLKQNVFLDQFLFGP